MSVEQAVQQLLCQCIEQRVHDLFIVKRDTYFQLFTKNITKLVHLPNLSLATGQAWLNYLKYRGQMNLSEKRRPQLGSLVFQKHDMKIYLRLSAVGDAYNRESLVVRFIYPLPAKLQTLCPEQLRQAITQGGMCVLSGPIGAGKTTTLYYLAQQLLVNKTVLTIEDPVEIINNDFIQLQVNDPAKMTYNELLKVSLRHHPDVLIIGELGTNKQPMRRFVLL